MPKPIIILTPHGPVLYTARGERPVFTLSSFEHCARQTPDLRLTLTEENRKPIIIREDWSKPNPRSLQLSIPRIPGNLIDPENGARKISYRGGCWIGNRHLLLSVWEYFPKHPLIAEFEVGQDALGKYKVSHIGTFRIPKSTEGGCIEYMGFDLDTHEVVYTDHLSSKVHKVAFKTLQANTATPVG